MGKVKRFIKYILREIPCIFLNSKKLDYSNFEKWVPAITKLYERLLKIIPGYPMKLFLDEYLKKIELFLNSNGMPVEVFVEKCMRKIYQLEDDEKYIFLYICYYLGAINDEVVKKYIQLALCMKNVHIRYLIAIDISKMTFMTQRGFYKEYYTDRRELLRLIAEDYFLETKVNMQSDNEDKICIITYMLDTTISNSVQRVTQMISTGLNKYYNEIAIISLDSFGVYNKRNLFSQFSHKFSIDNRKKINSILEKDNVKVYYFKQKKHEVRMKEILNFLIGYNPSFIIDISDEYSALSYYYYKLAKTYYIPLRNFKSSSFFNFILEKKWKYENSSYTGVDKSMIIDWFLPEYTPPFEKDMTREEIGIDNNCFVVLTIGNNENVINEELADKMCELLYERENIIWLLVGGKSPSYIHNNYYDLLSKKRIIEWGYEKNLAGMCAIGDVVLRPNTTGSSGATAIAAQKGLPIVMTNYMCDAMRWLGEDYSTISTYGGLIIEIKKLMDDEEYYMERKNKTISLVKVASDMDLAWKKLYDIVEKNNNGENDEK